MSFLPLLVVNVDALRVGIPLDAVARVEHACEVTPLPGAPDAVLGVVNLRGRVAAVVDLRRRLGLASRPLDPADSFVFVDLPQQLFALPVDDLEGVAEALEADLVPAGKLVEGHSHVKGIVRTRDGLLLIDDPEQFLDVKDMSRLRNALADVPGGGV